MTNLIQSQAVRDIILRAIEPHETQGQNKWKGVCPCGGEPHKVLYYYNTDGTHGLTCYAVPAHAYKAIEKAFADKFHIPIPLNNPAPIKNVQKTSINYPAHIQEMPQDFIDTCIEYAIKPVLSYEQYEYHMPDGSIAFWDLRLIHADGVKSPLSIFSHNEEKDDGTFVNKLKAKNPPTRGRPLYGLYDLAQGKGKTVIVVEGAKTAKVAKSIFQDAVIITWSGGALKPSMSDWTPLKTCNSKIILWPDNDETGIGIKAMKQIASLITLDKDDPRLFMVWDSYKSQFGDGWDLADPVPEGYTAAEILAQAQPIRATPISTEGFERLFQQYVKLQVDGDTIFVDTLTKTPYSNGFIPYVYYNSRSSMKEVERGYDATDRGKPTYHVDLWANSAESRILHGTTFDAANPEKAIVGKSGFECLNTFRGFDYPPKDCAPDKYKTFIEHINTALPPEHAKYMHSWIADLFQNPGRKLGVAVILRGNEGAGKGILGRILSSIIGYRHASMVNYAQMKQSRFNSYLTDKIFIGYDEFKLDGTKEQDAMDKLKSDVTEPTIEIEYKGKTVRKERSYHRFMMFSNHTDVINLDDKNRRFAIFEMSDVHINNREYLGPLYSLFEDEEGLAGLHAYYAKYKIDVNLFNIPSTEALEKVTTFSKVAHNYWYNVLQDCQFSSRFSSQLDADQVLLFGVTKVNIPRSLINHEIRIMANDMKLSNRLLTSQQTFMFPRSFNVNNPIYFNITKFNVVEKLQDRAFELGTWTEMRGWFEAEVGKKINWDPLPNMQLVVDNSRARDVM